MMSLATRSTGILPFVFYALEVSGAWDFVFFAAPGEGDDEAMSRLKTTRSCTFIPVAIGPGYAHVTRTPVSAISLRSEFRKAAYALFAAAYTACPGAGSFDAALHTPTIVGANDDLDESPPDRILFTIAFATSFVIAIAPRAFN